jgi:hypothetical protein
MKLTLTTNDIKRIIEFAAQQGFLTEGCSYEMDIKQENINLLIDNGEVVAQIELGDEIS